MCAQYTSQCWVSCSYLIFQSHKFSTKSQTWSYEYFLHLKRGAAHPQTLKINFFENSEIFWENIVKHFSWLRCYTRMGGLPVQMPLGTWLSIGTQLHCQAPSDLKGRKQSKTQWLNWVKKTIPTVVANNWPLGSQVVIKNPSIIKNCNTSTYNFVKRDSTIDTSDAFTFISEMITLDTKY